MISRKTLIEAVPGRYHGVMWVKPLFMLVFSAYFLSVPARGKTLNIPLMDAPVSLDWNGLSTMIEAPLILNLNEGLFGYGANSNTPVPALAESLEKSSDLTEYTFKIRKNAKWSDGRPVLAGDFANAWMRLISPQSVSIYIYYLFDILNAKEFNRKEISDPSLVGIKVSDDHTLKVILNRPYADWERTTAFWPLFPIRKDQIEKHGANWWRPGVLVSSGPFVLESYEAGRSVVLKRNPHYPAPKSDIDTLDFRISSDREEMIRKFKSGLFEFLWGMPTEMLRKSLPDTKPTELDLLRGHLLALNTAKFPMNNLEFRKALLKSVSTEKILPPDSSHLIPIKTFIPPPLAGSDGVAAFVFTPKEAKEHIRKSGVLRNSKLRIRILTSLSEPFFSIGKNIQTELARNLGVNVDLAAHQARDLTTYMNLGDYDATLITWTAKVFSPQDFLLPYSKDATYNRMNYSSKTFENRIAEGIRAKSRKEASRKFLEAQSILSLTDAVALPLFREKTGFVTNSRIKQIQFNHMGIPILKSVTH
ncbi:MAG: peptide ABC transporter substrate-binding protein [Bdellovibrionales bacterium]|nr:peptide ABC transporter substrate-binding protein [Bdellovibrionales bacterium]